MKGRVLSGMAEASVEGEGKPAKAQSGRLSGKERWMV